MRREMNFQSTSIGCSSMTFTTHRDVSHAHGHTGAPKTSRSAMPPGLSGARFRCSRASGRVVKAIVADDEPSLAPQRAEDEARSFDDLYRREQPELVRLAVLLV